MRRVIVALVVVGLAAAIFIVWPRSGVGPGADGPTTTALATPTTTTPGSGPTTPLDSTSTSTSAETRVVETVEEAEEILRELWFGWFEGIYNQDEDRIREVVANPDLVRSALEQFGDMEFQAEPTHESIGVSGTEILHADEDCLAVWATVDAGFRSGELVGVHVLRWDERWLLINTWVHREDLWESDCDVQLP